MGRNMMHVWLNSCYRKRPGGFFRIKKALLIIDSIRPHLTEDVKKKVSEENTIPVIIPGSLTKILQPLDISVNKSFKTNLRQILESLTIEELSLTKTGRLRRATLTNVAEWVLQEWKDVTPICIINGFRKAEIGTPL